MKHDPDKIRAQVRETSKLLTNREHRLDVIALIVARDSPVFFARELARTLSIGDNQVSDELALLRMIGAAQQLEAAMERQRYFQRLPHPIWVFAPEMVARTVAGMYPETPLDAMAEYAQSVYGCTSLTPAFTMPAQGDES